MDGKHKSREEEENEEEDRNSQTNTSTENCHARNHSATPSLLQSQAADIAAYTKDALDTHSHTQVETESSDKERLRDSDAVTNASRKHSKPVETVDERRLQRFRKAPHQLRVCPPSAEAEGMPPIS
jgi:hypothetical protein